MARLLNGQELQDFVKERQAHQVRGLVQHFKSQPKLAIIVTNNDPIIDACTRLEKSYGEDIQIAVDIHRIDQAGAAGLIEKLNNDNTVKGIVLQLPLADPTQTDKLVNMIDPHKDVDGLGQKAEWGSATVIAINWLLAGYNIDLAGKNVAIVGREQLVGRLLAQMWRNSGIELKVLDGVCHDLATELADQDVVVTAVDTPGLIKSNMLGPGVVVVDAGVAESDGRIVGDLDPAVRLRTDLTLTPEKGGVGPLIIAALMDNVIRASYPAATSCN